MKGNKEKEAFRATKTWKDFSKKLRKERPYCELCWCKSKTLQVHHMDEENYQDLDPSKFMVLCRTCHQYVSRLERIKPENWHKYNPVWVSFCKQAFINKEELNTERSYEL